jgi:hypothetical protein
MGLSRRNYSCGAGILACAVSETLNLKRVRSFLVLGKRSNILTHSNIDTLLEKSQISNLKFKIQKEFADGYFLDL